MLRGSERPRKKQHTLFYLGRSSSSVVIYDAFVSPGGLGPSGGPRQVRTGAATSDRVHGNITDQGRYCRGTQHVWHTASAVIVRASNCETKRSSADEFCAPLYLTSR